MDTKFYVEKVNGSCIDEYWICRRSDGAIWAKAYAEDIANIILDSLSNLQSTDD